MGNKWAMALVEGEKASCFIDTDEDTVYEKFRPFDVGLSCDWMWDGSAVGIR